MKKYLLTLSVLFFCTEMVIAQVNLSAGLIAYYPMDNSPLDSTSNHLDLSATGSPMAATDRFGVSTGAYSFNSATPDYFTGPFDALLAPTEVTVAAWVNLIDAFRDQK